MPAHAMCPDHSQGRAGPPVACVAFARLCWASRCPRGVCPCVLGPPLGARPLPLCAASGRLRPRQLRAILL